MTSFNDDWETIEVPRGTFYGWSSNPSSAGRQRIVGEVMQFSYDGGTDFNGHSCPQLTLITSDETLSFNKQEEYKKIPAGELVVVTCGTVNLANAVLAANLKPGDFTMITLTGFTQVDKGIAKQYDIKVKRGSGKPQNNAARAQQASPQSDPWGGGNGGQPAPASDPWGSAPPAQPAPAAASDPWGTGIPAQQQPVSAGFPGDEPPF